MVMSGPADTWHPVLLQIIAKVYGDLQEKAHVAVLEKKLNLVGSVTRHDILNQLTAVSGYTELLEMVIEDPQMKSYIGKVRYALDKIRRQFQFAKDYQNLGTEQPRWQTIDSVIRRARDSVSLNGVTITEPDRTVSVFADLSIERAMALLLDNSVRHGQHVSQIAIGVLETPDGATLVVEDNGVGIPLSDKERIFERGFGKYTGWGLFLTREILALTGIKIVETGEPGKGARFEIQIPAESYKKKGA
jgi:signal transduction histidine kinase